MGNMADSDANARKRDICSRDPSNFEKLLRLPNGEYTPPELPVTLPTFPNIASEQFGHSFRKAHFFLEPTVFLNHGAFGAALKESLQCATAWREYCEQQPLRFLDREALPHLVHVIRRLAAFVSVDPCDIVLVTNATTGNCTVIRSLLNHMDPADSICFFNTTYGATEKLLDHVKSDFNVNTYCIDIAFPVQCKGDIISIVKEKLRPGTKLMVLDHIASYYGIVSPVKEIIDFCHSRGVMVLVDGAHAMGSMQLNLREIGADFYLMNCHKWFCSPKGCAVMYVAPEHQSKIRPLVVSHGFGFGFCSEFAWNGLKDYSLWLALHTVLDFWEQCNPERIRQYIHDTVQKGANLLVQEWGTGLLADISLFGPMVVVELPPLTLFADKKDSCALSEAEQLQDLLFYKHNIEVPVKAVQGKLYVRVSAHVHNELSEFKQLAEVISALACKEDPAK